MLIEAVSLPAEGSIARGMPYMNILILMKDMNGQSELQSPLTQTEIHLKKEKNFMVFTVVCHGKKGDGQGKL